MNFQTFLKDITGDNRSATKRETEDIQDVRGWQEVTQAAKAGINKLLDGTQEMVSRISDPARSIMQENSAYIKELKKNETLEAIRKHKRAAQKTKLYQEMDRIIHRAYYGDSGIRFYSELLLEYVKHILPHETETERMWIGGYNSCIAHMRRQWEKAEAKFAQRERQLDDIEAALAKDADALRSVGYKSIKETYQEYKTSGGKGKNSEALQEKLKNMEHICAVNKAAVAEAREYCRTEPVVTLPKKESLHLALKKVLESEMAEKLADCRGMTAEDYRAVLENYARSVETELLGKFGVPDKDQSETV